MNIEDFQKFFDGAKVFLDDYLEKTLLIQAQAEVLKDPTLSTKEKEQIDLWIHKNMTWIVNNEERYNKALMITSLPHKEVEQLFKAYREIYDDNPVSGL